jgi:hypothetical protein
MGQSAAGLAIASSGPSLKIKRPVARSDLD